MKSIFFVLALLILNLCCINSLEKGKRNESKEVKIELTNEDFDSFYLHFHADSVFQMSRVLFPLPSFDSEKSLSEPDDSTITIDGELVNYYWQQKDWIMHKAIAKSEDLIVDRKSNDTIVVENIFIPNSDFKIKRIFKLINRKWYLVYYWD